MPAISLFFFISFYLIGIVPVPEHTLPFSETVGATPSLEAMRKIVVVDKKRPFLSDKWNNHKVIQHNAVLIIEAKIVKILHFLKI